MHSSQSDVHDFIMERLFAYLIRAQRAHQSQGRLTANKANKFFCSSHKRTPVEAKQNPPPSLVHRTGQWAVPPHVF